MMRKLLWLTFLIALLAVVINDGGRWFNGQSNLSQATSQLGSWATANAGGLSLDAATQAVDDHASQLGITVTRYTQDDNGFQIATKSSVQGTWILGPYLAVYHGVPFRKSFDTPMVIEDQVTAGFH